MIDLKARALAHPFGHEIRLVLEAEMADVVEAALAEVYANLRRRLRDEIPQDIKALKDVWDLVKDKEWWDEQGRIANRGLTPMAHRVLLAGAQEAVKLVGVAVSFDAMNPGMIRFTRQFTNRWWKEMERTRREALRQALIDWQQGGLGRRGMPDLLKTLEQVYGRQSAELVGTTEVTRLFAEGSLAAWQDMEGVARVEWATAEDELVCPICRALNGKRWPKGNPGRVPPAHPRCLLPGNLVVGLGRIEAMTRARYDGPALEFATESGQKLSVTPNHLILTPRGFVAAETLQVGDDVVHCTDPERIAAAIDPDNEHRPACVEEVWDAFAMQRQMLRRVVPSAAEQFHGDGRFMNGNVNIVAPDGLLLRDGNSAFPEHIGQGEFNRGGAGHLALPPQRMAGLFGFGYDSPPALGVSCLGLQVALLHSRALPLDGLSLGLSSRLDAVLQEPAPHARTRQPVGVREGVLALAGQVAAHQVRNIDSLAAGPGLESVSTQNLEEGTHGEAEFIQELAKRFPGVIAPQKIIEIRHFHFAGHVYDLQTSVLSYIASGIVNHNCRCSLLPVAVGASRATQPQPGLAERLQSAEVPIADDTVETALVFDADGKVLLNKTGDRNSGSFTADEVRTMKDATLTHNHPVGTSLSREDVMLAIQANMAEMRAVTQDYVFELPRPSTGWPNAVEVDQEFKTWDSLIKADWRAAIQDGQMTVEWANANHNHEVWIKVANALRGKGVRLVYKRVDRT